MTTATLPARMARLPIDKHGRPIPWFVHIDDDGVPDFRVIRRRGIEDALRFELCWVCGHKRGRHAAFVLGPMCAVNRTSAEPPSHLDCARYSAQACPFLTTPKMVRRERGIEDYVPPAGTMIPRNPGVALVWSSRMWGTFRDPRGGLLFDIGEPSETSWWAHGREATRDEVDASIETGLPILREIAEQQRGGVEQLDRMVADAQQFLPVGATL